MPPKRKFVSRTLKGQEKINKANEGNATAKRMVAVEDIEKIVSDILYKKTRLSNANAKRKLTVEEKIVSDIPYKKTRQMNIASNNEHIASLNLHNLDFGLTVPGRNKGKGKVDDIEGIEGYCPTNYSGHDSMEDEDDIPNEPIASLNLTTDEEGIEGYCPTNNSGHDSLEDERDILSKQTKQVVTRKVRSKRATRSQFNIASAAIKGAKQQVDDGPRVPRSKLAANRRLNQRKNKFVPTTSADNEAVGSLLNLISDKMDDGKRVPHSSPFCNTRLQRQRMYKATSAAEHVPAISTANEVNSLNFRKENYGKTLPPSSPTCNTLLQRQRKDWVGSNAESVSLWIRREQEKSVADSVFPQSDVQTTEKSTDEVSQRKKRGKTKMVDVHATIPISSPCDTLLQRQRKDGSKEESISLQERREQEKNVGESVLPQSDVHTAEDSTDVVAQRRKRGRTRMFDVHTRTFNERKLIPLNENFQPVSDDSKLISEFSSFLGTLARDYVPLVYVSWHKVPFKNNLWEYVKEKYIIAEEGKAWVMKALRDAWKTYKSRMKKKHYTSYDNDDERIENKPDDIPLEEFKVLLTYWGNAKVKELAEKNSANRKKVTCTHTAGPRSFAQISKKIQLSKPNGKPPSKAEIFIETRKRKDGRDYRSQTEVINNIISELREEMCSSEGRNENGQEQHNVGESSRGPFWLLGRHALPRKMRASIHAEEYSRKIQQQLRAHVEEMVKQQVKENMTLLVKRLIQDNPNININLENDGDDYSENESEDDSI